VIRASDLSKEFTAPEGRLSILSGLNLTVEPGDAVAVLGESGSGKSTLLGILAGLDSPTSGHVRLFGQRLDTLDEDGRARLRAGRVGFVFQSFQLLPGLTALENVALPLELAGANVSRDEVVSVLERVGLSHRLDHYPTQLSGGEQQRVAIARAFAAGPQVLFADEPTGNLDQTTGKRIADLLFALRAERGTTLILVTHDVALAERCSRRFRLRDGKLLEVVK
jgi:putative ABC transport system ATP-binding protein